MPVVARGLSYHSHTGRRGYLHRVRSRTLSPRLSPLQSRIHTLWLRGTHAPTIFFLLFFIFSQEDRVCWQRVAIICNIHVVGKSRDFRRETSSTALLFPRRSFASFKNFQIVSLSLVNVRQLGKNILGYVYTD